MKLITQEGIKQFEKLFGVKKVAGSTTSTYLSFATDKASQGKMIWKCRDKQIEYYLQEGGITLKHEDLFKLLPSEYFKDTNVWKGKDKFFICSEMDHQRLSNCIGLLDMMLRKGKISKKSSEDFLRNLKETIIPEIEERFNGEVLDYIPYYEWEKEMIKLPDVVFYK